MARLILHDEKRTLEERGAIKNYLASEGIDFETWEPTQDVSPGASSDSVLAAYREEIERLKAQGGYVTADVIDVSPSTVGLEAMLAKFRREHWHDEDEVRFVIEGRGLFQIHPRGKSVFGIEVQKGDLIRVPRGTWHWFDLCEERRIRAIRLFQDPAGWTPRYTESGEDARYEPVCFGRKYWP